MSSYILCKNFSFKTRFAQKVLNTSGPNSSRQKNRALSIFRTNAFVAPGHQQLKRGLVADTLLLMMFLRLRKLGNICCGHKMFLNKIRNLFCVPDIKFVSATNVARAGKRGNICVGNNVSSFARAFLPIRQIFLYTLYKDSSILDNPNK